MNILMIAHYITFPSEGGNNRFCYILNLLKKNKQNKIELITSDFRHATKEKHKITKDDIEKLGYKVTLIHEPKYTKNISIKRLISAKKFANNTKKYLNSLNKKPDVIYCAVPSLDVAKEAAKYAKKHGIRFIIDIQDLWPEAFKMAIDIPIISDLAFYPMKKTANYIYAAADEIIAVSQTYLNRGLKENKKTKGISVYLGTDLKDFEKNANNPNNTKYKEFTIAYVGTLSYSYKIKSIIDAIDSMKKSDVSIKLLVMGDGPLKAQYESYAKSKKINYEFTGKLPYKEMCYRLARCHAAVNPISDKSAASIINKVADYMAAGLPVINTQNATEYQALLEENHLGFNCELSDIKKIKSALISIYNYDDKERNLIYKNAKNCAKKLFDRKETYKRIIDSITNCGHQKIQILLSCMNEDIGNLIKRSNLSDINTLIINQCDNITNQSEYRHKANIREIKTPTKGLSVSRNIAIRNSMGDICILADDDEVFKDNLQQIVSEAYKKLPDADLIIFDIINTNKKFKKTKKKLKYLDLLKVSSWQISFKINAIKNKKILFDESIGAGTDNGAGEENKFLLECYKQKLNIYYYPAEIATMHREGSTWFRGYNSKFFYNRGKTTRYIYGIPFSIIYSLYFIIAKRSLYKKDISTLKAAKYIFKGITDNGFKK